MKPGCKIIDATRACVQGDNAWPTITSHAERHRPPIVIPHAHASVEHGPRLPNRIPFLTSPLAGHFRPDFQELQNLLGGKKKYLQFSQVMLLCGLGCASYVSPTAWAGNPTACVETDRIIQNWFSLRTSTQPPQAALFFTGRVATPPTRGIAVSALFLPPDKDDVPSAVTP